MQCEDLSWNGSVMGRHGGGPVLLRRSTLKKKNQPIRIFSPSSYHVTHAVLCALEEKK